MLIRGKVKYRFQGHREVSQQSLLKHSLLLTSDSGEKERDDMRKSPRLNENATPSARPGNSLSHELLKTTAPGNIQFCPVLANIK